MPCSSMENLARYAAGELPSHLRARLERHLAECAACRANVASLRRLENLLEDLPEATLPPDLTNVVMHRLQAKMPVHRTSILTTDRLITSWASGLAAVMALSLAIWYVVGQAPDLDISTQPKLARVGSIPPPGSASQFSEPAAASSMVTALPVLSRGAKALSLRRSPVVAFQPAPLTPVRPVAIPPVQQSRQALGQATMYAALGDAELRAAALENVAAAYPDSTEAVTALLVAADLHVNAGDTPAADSAYRRVTMMRQAPVVTQALAYKNLGDLRRQEVGDDELTAHNYQMAAQLLRRVTEQGETHDQAHALLALGEVEESMGEINKAATAYVRAGVVDAASAGAAEANRRLAQVL